MDNIKKILLTTYLVLVVQMTVQGQYESTPSLTSLGLKGSVRMLTQHLYNVYEGVEDPRPLGKKQYIFDTSGRVIEYKQHEEGYENHIYLVEKWEYNAEGNPEMKTSDFYNPGGKIKGTFEYDSLGQLYKYREFRDDYLYVHAFLRDSIGRLTHYYGFDNKELSWEERWNAKELPEADIHFMDSREKITYEYDSLSRLHIEKHYLYNYYHTWDGERIPFGEQTLHETINYSYNDEGVTTKETCISSLCTTLTKDSAGNKMEERRTEKRPGSIEWNRIIQWDYDAAGNTIERRLYEGDKPVRTKRWVYEYDTYGNYVTKTEVYDENNSTMDRTVRRTIEYF